MSHPVSFTRFCAVVEAYGADPLRWPETDRHAMLDFMAQYPQDAAPVLDEARQLDQWLDVLTPAPALTPRSADARQQTRRTGSHRRSWLRIGWAGLGIAACIAGAAIGINLSLHSLHDMRAVHMLDQVQLSEVDY